MKPIKHYIKRGEVRKKQRRQIVDIPATQQQLTTLKKDNQRTPKCTHRVP
jgi:hypothetical protein